ncbi:unnamed protein product [Adineta ricciae]|uniref:Uncharacterized protein n=1 Tax=Adineta ricciae TaxID=249248 RepID=A0A815MZ23_ADIRI|nr:unnamed protein product [Adineta ricciae]CAF1430020.1 unnamed protein product [Adineta ricciae]
MDDLMNDLEAGFTYNPARTPHKKMKKRKQLDALLKFRSAKSNRLSNEVINTSEDELFLPEKKSSLPTHLQSLRQRRWWSYIRHILSFCFVCIFMIVCVGLAYANIELKSEVQNLSSRVTEIEKRFTNSDITRVLSSIEQLKNRLNVIERWNVSYIYDRLQKLHTEFNQIKPNALSAETSMTHEDVDVSSKLDKVEAQSTHFSDVADELEKLSRDADEQVTHIVTEKTKTLDKKLIEHLLEQERRENAHQDTNQLAQQITSLNETLYINAVKWQKELSSFRTELQSLNQSSKFQDFTIQFQELSTFMHNSTEKTSIITSRLQSDLDKLRIQLDACKCSKEPTILKPSIVDSNQLQQTLVTKPNMDKPPPSLSSSSSPLSPTASTTIVSLDKADQSRKIITNNTVDIAQVMNQTLTPTN